MQCLQKDWKSENQLKYCKQRLPFLSRGEGGIEKYKPLKFYPFEALAWFYARNIHYLEIFPDPFIVWDRKNADYREEKFDQYKDLQIPAASECSLVIQQNADHEGQLAR